MLITIVLLVVFGFVIGLVAHRLGGAPLSLVEACGVGIAGALVGGLVARGIGWMNTPGSAIGLAIALAGALTMIVVARGLHRPA